MRRMRLSVLFVLLAACSSTRHAAVPTTVATCKGGISGASADRPAELRGALLIAGPFRGYQPTSGTVTIASLPSRTTCQVQVGRDGRFVAQLAPGTYAVSGRSPMFGYGRYPCGASRPVVVRRGDSVSPTNVFCNER